jgi:hypothetical protein
MWMCMLSPRCRYFVFKDDKLAYHKSDELDVEKPISLSHIYDVQCEFDDPTLVLGSRSNLLNFQFTCGATNRIFRLAAEECEGADASVEQWLRVLRHYESRSPGTKPTFADPPRGSLRPGPCAAEETENEAAAATTKVDDGREYEEVSEGVRLYTTHTQSREQGHEFRFELAVLGDKLCDFQLDFTGSQNMQIVGSQDGRMICQQKVEARSSKEVAVVRQIDVKRRAHLTYETAIAEYMLQEDDSDED